MALLANQTRIAIHVIIQDDTGRVESLLIALTALVTLFLSLGQFVTVIMYFTSDLLQSFDFTLKVLGIVFKALAFGAGVRL